MLWNLHHTNEIVLTDNCRFGFSQTNPVETKKALDEFEIVVFHKQPTCYNLPARHAAVTTELHRLHGSLLLLLR